MMSLPGARSRGFSSRPLFFFLDVLLQFLLAFASTGLHRLLSLQKKRNAWFCLPGHLGCRRVVLVAQDFLHSLCFFFGVLLQFFLAFGSGSLHRLQGLQKQNKNNIREEPTKQQRALSNVLAQDFVQRLCFFGGVFLQFFVFGSGSLHRLLRLKNKNT